jgi:hypothetical protein
MKWLVLVIAFAMVLTALVWRGLKGPAHTLASIEEPIGALLKRGYDGGFLVIKISYSRKFIQLRKYINAPGEYGISLVFPKAAWSLGYFDKLEEFCKKVGIDYTIEMGGSDKHAMEFLFVDFGKDSARAHEFVVQLLVEVFNVDEDVTLFVRLEDAAVEDRLIDRDGL